MKKIILSSLLAVGLVLFLYYFTAVFFPKRSLEIAGSSLFQTDFSIGKVDLKLSQKSATIQNLRISNPEGYSESYAVYIGRLDTSGLNFQNGVLTIDEIRVSDSKFLLELANGKTNFSTLEDNLQKSFESLSKKGDDKKSSAEKSKFIVRKLVIAQSKAGLKMLPGQDPLEIDLPEIEIKDLGDPNNASDLSSVLKRVVGSLGTSILKNSIRIK